MKNQNPQFLIFFIFFFGLSTAQVKKAEIIQTKNKISNKGSAELFNKILKEDSLVFEAFNKCDTLSYRKHFKDYLEFYHDLGGLTVGIENEMKSIREMCSRGSNIRRELVVGSMEVYPLKNYGAVQIAVHRFYHRNQGQSEKLSGEYKFIHIWQLTDGVWKISRIISYGHDVMNND
ncbi:hypothetical protein M2347_002095 [Chryseobacterium sp. H1D6B]|uniref:nuclear transport factor 2 family protein n=1 Tax=Chryseobacterium sp. H1D6B TaxID=2940588 RepID=UPI0015C96177|nr:nuclear transport factor 2 family protein [Chryseobacterium sp. H1D6B]MDH6252368.1 hypothetical protein [Chryseobacterium sp. H1D6B]